MRRSRSSTFNLQPSTFNRPRGFTLVEMLVAVALVLLMMLLFTQVFQAASKSMNQQKGMAENDQKARLLTILMRGELADRTFQDLKPFRYQQQTYDPEREGYFSISENFVNVDTDDVLQFTIKLPTSELPLSGRTVLLKYYGSTAATQDTATASGSTCTLDIGSTMTGETLTPDQYLFYSVAGDLTRRNQPEFDDGQVNVNGTGSSNVAEICYFLRGGNLYRRVLLVRRTYDNGGVSANPNQPPMLDASYGDYDSNKTITLAPINGSGEFWRDHDYSAFHLGTTGMTSNGMKFHSVLLSLRNDNPAGNGGAVGGYPFSLGIPHLRFGWGLYKNNGTSFLPGAPREWTFGADGSPGADGVDDDGNGSTDTLASGEYDIAEFGYGDDEFIGRFTMQETSHSNFGYPGRNPSGGNPMDPATALSVDATTGLVNQYSNEIYRRGEDIVLTNVHSFDIKVWDDHPSVRAFVDLGHTRRDASNNPVGYYNISSRRNTTLGNRYDTWNPNLGSGTNPFPPYFPAENGVDGQPGAAMVDDNDSDGDGDPDTGADESDELGWETTDDVVHPLLAIQITIRYYDVSSGQLRQVTLVHSLKK